MSSLNVTQVLPEIFAIRGQASASKSVLRKQLLEIVPSQQVDFSPGVNQLMRFNLSSNNDFFEGPDSYLRFNLQFTPDDGTFTEDVYLSLGRGGVHNLFKSIELRNIHTGMLIQRYEYYNRWNNLLSLVHEDKEYVTKYGYLSGDRKVLDERVYNLPIRLAVANFADQYDELTNVFYDTLPIFYEKPELLNLGNGPSWMHTADGMTKQICEDPEHQLYIAAPANGQIQTQYGQTNYVVGTNVANTKFLPMITLSELFKNVVPEIWRIVKPKYDDDVNERVTGLISFETINPGIQELLVYIKECLLKTTDEVTIYLPEKNTLNEQGVNFNNHDGNGRIYGSFLKIDDATRAHVSVNLQHYTIELDKDFNWPAEKFQLLERIADDGNPAFDAVAAGVPRDYGVGEYRAVVISTSGQNYPHIYQYEPGVFKLTHEVEVVVDDAVIGVETNTFYAVSVGPNTLMKVGKNFDANGMHCYTVTRLATTDKYYSADEVLAEGKAALTYGVSLDVDPKYCTQVRVQNSQGTGELDYSSQFVMDFRCSLLQQTLPLFLMKGGIEIIFELDDASSAFQCSKPGTYKIVNPRIMASMISPHPDVVESFASQWRSEEGLVYKIPSFRVRRLYERHDAQNNSLNTQVGVRDAQRVYWGFIPDHVLKDQNHTKDYWVQGNLSKYQLRVGSHEFPNRDVQLGPYTWQESVYQTFVNAEVSGDNIRMLPENVALTPNNVPTEWLYCVDLRRAKSGEDTMAGVDLSIVPLDFLFERQNRFDADWEDIDRPWKGKGSYSVCFVFVAHDAFFKLSANQTLVIL